MMIYHFNRRERWIKNQKENNILIDAKQLQDIMKYLMTRPYAEVYALMHIMTTLNLAESRWRKGWRQKII